FWVGAFLLVFMENFIALLPPNVAVPVFPIPIAVWAVLLWFASRRDEVKKTTVMVYQLEDEAEKRYQLLHDAFAEAGKCGGAWHIGAKGAAIDAKRQAGASTIVRRAAIRLTTQVPKYVETNIAVPAIPVGTETL